MELLIWSDEIKVNFEGYVFLINLSEAMHFI